MFVPTSPAAAAPQNLCAAQVAAAEAIVAQIQAHNAQPHLFELPDQQAAYEAYNAEAAALDAQRNTIKANLQTCLDAMEALADSQNGSAGLNPPPETTRKSIEDAAKQVPPGFTPPPPPLAGRNWRVPKTSPLRPLYDTLRAGNPGNLGNVRLQGASRPSAGSADPAYPAASGRTIGLFKRGDPAASPDHIIPLAEILYMPNFLKLTPQNMYVVTRAPVNLQWMSEGANLSKQSRSVAAMSGVDPQWQAAQVQLENQVRQKLQDLINKLVSSQV